MTYPSLKIAVLGAGSIGCYLGGQLAAGGARVNFIGRERFQNELRTNGLTLTHFARKPLHITSDNFDYSLSPSAANSADIVLICVKSQDSFTAAKSIAPFVKTDSIIISFQNGVGNPDAIAKALPNNTVLGAIVPFNVTGTEPGCFHSGTEGDLMVQDHSDERLAALKAVFSKSGQNLDFQNDIRAYQWGKLLINLNNALNALTGGTLHEGLSQRDYREALAAMLEEALDVVKGAGITPQNTGKVSTQVTIDIMRLPDEKFHHVMEQNIKIDKTARSSMLDDLELGRGTEIDYLQGEIVKLANKTGRSTPINAAVMEAVKAAFASGKSPKMTGTQILGLF